MGCMCELHRLCIFDNITIFVGLILNRGDYCYGSNGSISCNK